MKIVEMTSCCDLNLKFMTNVLARLKGLSWERAQAFEQTEEDKNTFSHEVKMCGNEKHAPLKPSSCTFTLGIENIVMGIFLLVYTHWVWTRDVITLTYFLETTMP